MTHKTEVISAASPLLCNLCCYTT